jgi:ATP-binding cassette subfamily F protein 3
MDPPAMLHLNDLTLRIAGRPLLEGATLHVPAGTRMGLVGRNGTGKSTLLKLIAGELQPDAGSLRLQAGARIGVVKQEAPGGTMTPLEAVLATDTERTRLLEEARTTTDPHRIAEVHNRLAEIGADAAPARAARILKGLGFDDAAQEQPLSAFSGGWRMRVALAGVLFLEPDLLLLDEPTNHLDLEAAMWLEEHLKRYPRTLILVSHDRDFLNSVPEKICHLEGRKLTVYAGGYDQFERTRREKLLLAEKARQRQEAERAHIQAFVDRFRYKASKARQAQSRIKMLERMQPIAQALVEPEIRFTFPAGAIPAPPMITMDAARVGYGEKVVLDRLSLRIDPDDRIALLGRNGNGKSTFAKLIAGRLEPMAGELTRARGLKVGFFAQHQIEDLMPEETPIRHVQARRPLESEQQIRSRLARFGLGQERAETRAQHLSGGEKTRLAMTLMCLDEPQMLILDEPTNHLDIDSREALVEAVNGFEGAVIVISHDRHLVELVADSLWLVADGRVKPYEGDLDDYRRLLLETSAEPAAPVAEKPKPDRRSAGERRSLLAPLRQRAKEAEREVEKLGTERARIEAKLADPASYGNGTDIGALQRRLAELASLTEAAETRWLEAEAEIERVEAA